MSSLQKTLLKKYINMFKLNYFNLNGRASADEWFDFWKIQAII